jgi:predicted metal-dependent hydrolase
MATEHKYLLDIDGTKVPVKIIVERRNGARVSLASESVIIRVPKSMWMGTDVQKHVDWAVNWIKNLKKSNPTVLDKYLKKRRYLDGEIFKIGGESFMLDIQRESRDSGRILLGKEGDLVIRIPNGGNYDEQELIRKLVIKFCQRFFERKITEKVKYYNDTYFKKEINSVKLKYNKSNWGSCSTGKNLNFSIRLMFAPEDVIDYVVVHELAHLIEMNHGDRFWKIVETVMPNYIQKEKVLKEKNAEFDF